MSRCLLVLVLLVAVSAVAANESQRNDVERAAHAIFGDFMSPYCPGLLLADCRSPGAVELRREIRAQLAAGVSERAVRQELEAQFGEKLLAAPPAHGFGLLAWVMPFLAVGVGLLLMLSWMQAHRPPSAAETRATGAVDVALRARFESELRDFDHRT